MGGLLGHADRHPVVISLGKVHFWGNPESPHVLIVGICFGQQFGSIWCGPSIIASLFSYDCFRGVRYLGSSEL